MAIKFKNETQRKAIIWTSAIIGFLILIYTQPKPEEKPISPYSQIESVFIGNPSSEKVQKLIDAMLVRYDMPITEDNIMKVADVLLNCRKQSNVGVTEMDILTHAYKGIKKDGVSIEMQLAISAFVLERK
jgi:hypothetical protein